ncbi:MAG: DJ-1/PfpI family protein [Bacteroidales bacterium]|nr:DJ-1/PfpI family protein [Bacteroidales bacterium]
MKGINIFLANGFEDIEALAVNDVLRRGGVPVQLVAIGDEPFVTSSHGVTIGVENFLEDMDLSADSTCSRDVMIFPGGMPGSKNLAACGKLVKAMKEHYAAGGTVAAICAAPGLVLGQLDDLQGVEFTCFDGFEGYLEAKGAKFVPAPALTSGRIVTGRSAGYAVEFGLEILKQILKQSRIVVRDDVVQDDGRQEDKVQAVRNAMLLKTIGQ